MPYDAFLSYSQADGAVVARALHRALHTFARPRFTRRAIHVFRDDVNLSANPDLWTTIDRHLGEARYLVFVASPKAAGSIWVRRELHAWLTRDPRAERLILVLAGGEVLWSADKSGPDWSATDALPRETELPPGIVDARIAVGAALAAQPLWIDLRWMHTLDQGDLRDPRFRDAVRQISATIRGVDPTDIDGEDLRLSRQRARVASAGIVALFVLLFATAGFAVYAQEMRARAETALAGSMSVLSQLFTHDGVLDPTCAVSVATVVAPTLDRVVPLTEVVGAEFAWNSRLVRAMVHRRLPGRRESAIAELVQFAAHRTDDPDPWFVKGNAEMEAERWEDAAASYGEAIRREPRAGFLASRAEALLRGGDLSAAAADVDLARAADPGAVTPALLQAEIAFQRGDHARAAVLFAEVTTLAPDHHVAWSRQIQALSRLGRQDETIRVGHAAQAALGSDPELLAQLALEYAMAERYAEAQKYSVAALEATEACGVAFDIYRDLQAPEQDP
ncbi:MAG: TIR domain-containing protein [Myxococcota bacterium]